VIPARTAVLVAGQRTDVALTVNSAVQSAVSEYVRVAAEAERLLTVLLQREAALLAAGETLSLETLRQQERARAVLLAVQDRLAVLAETGQVAARNALTNELVPLAVDYENALIRSQLPADLQGFGVRVSPEALEAVIVRADDRLRYLRNMSQDVARTVNRTLVDGIVVGDNPRDAARTLLRRVGRALDGGVVRAERIMRTEMLDAYRNANSVIQNANSDVVDMWEWWSAGDFNTCASCWAMHGEQFPVEVPGPDDHPNGRCARIPVVRANLRGDFPMGPSRDELWGRLDQQQRLRVLGPSRYELTGGGPPPRDFSRQIPAGEWRAYRVATPVRDLVNR
jgi:SPP1 gp7 family putative phage head morphogenesis protein